MLSKDQASAIADEILGQARAQRERQSSASLSVGALYRCRELRSLPKWMQIEVARQAALAVWRSPFFIFLALAWIFALAMLSLYWFDHSLRSALIGPSIVVCGLVPMLIRSLLVRREIRIIAAELDGPC